LLSDTCMGEEEVLLHLVAIMIQHLVATVGEHRISKRGARLHNITYLLLLLLMMMKVKLS